MMSLGSFGGGGGPSSSPSPSNLSALAPPFTVDRSNSNPLLQFSDLPYVSSFGHTWQYANPTASRLDMFQKSELEADYTNIPPVASENDYDFQYPVSQSNSAQDNNWSPLNSTAKTSADPFLFDPKVGTYYPPYISPGTDERTPLVALSDSGYDVLPSSGLVSANVSAQADYTQCLSGLEYTPSWGSSCYGPVDAKRGKNAEVNGSFVRQKYNASDSAAFTNYLNQGCNMVECENIPEEASGSSCSQFSDVIGRESGKHLVTEEAMDGISFLAQKALSLPFDSSATSISDSYFTMSESLAACPCMQTPKNSSSYQNPYNSYGKGSQPISSCFSTSVSVTKSSPTLVIRPPPVVTGLASQKSTTHKTVDAAPVHQNKGLGNKSPSGGKEPHVLQNSGGAEGSFWTSKLKDHKDETKKLFSLSSSVVERLPSKVQNKDTLSPSRGKEPQVLQKSGGAEGSFWTSKPKDHKDETDKLLSLSSSVVERQPSKVQNKDTLRKNSESQFLNVNTLDGSSFSDESVLAIKLTENFADCLDHHNPAVDSPCWKGAPSSQFATFDHVETDSSHPFVKKIDEYHLLNLQKHPYFHPLHDPIGSPSEKAGKDRVHRDHGSAAAEHHRLNLQNHPYFHPLHDPIGSPSEKAGKDRVHRDHGSAATEHHRLNLQNHPYFLPLHDPIGSPSEKAGKDKVHRDHGSAATEHTSVGMAKVIPIPTSSEEVPLCKESSKAGEEYDSLIPSKSDSLLSISEKNQLGGGGCNFATNKPNLQAAATDTMITINDIAEDGAVAVRAAEDVLCSPSSEDSDSEQVKPHGSVATPKMDVQTLISAMKNLSDLLVFSCSSNGCELKEQDHEALKHVMSNLDSLLSQRMVYMTQQKEPLLPQLNKCGKVVEYLRPPKSVGAGKPQVENEAYLKLNGQVDLPPCREGRKAAIFQHSSSLSYDLDCLDNDNISKAIRKVLDENSYFSEEEHSQTLLFKSLWLDAEAKLCSISYRARFARMKIELERFKSKQAKENIADPQKLSRSENSHAQNTSFFRPLDVENVESVLTPKTATQSSPSNADSVEASVMARLHMLNTPDDPKTSYLVLQQPADDVEASVMTRFHILKGRDDTNPIAPVGQQVDILQPVHSDDSVSQSPGNSGKRNQFSAGSTDNSSSDWEHVLKEDFS